MEQDPELKQMLRESVRLNTENNQILKKMLKTARVNAVFRFIYWVVIIVLAVQAYYFLAPYIQNLMTAYNQIQGTEVKVSSFNLGDYIKSFGKTSTSSAE